MSEIVTGGEGSFSFAGGEDDNSSDVFVNKGYLSWFVWREHLGKQHNIFILTRAKDG